MKFVSSVKLQELQYDGTVPNAWTFLSNHGHVLIQIARDPDARIRDIADAVGITERRAHMILSDLEEAGYITITRVGRRSHYRVHRNRRFRHPAESAKPINELLAIFER